MKAPTKLLQIFPYGRASSALELLRKGGKSRGTAQRSGRKRSLISRKKHGIDNVWVAFSHELDDAFAREFTDNATASTRLLVFNEGHSTDNLLSRLISLQIRSSHRFYVADCTGIAKTHCISGLLERLASALEGADGKNRILDAKLEGGLLHVVSPEFNRLEVAIDKIPALAKAAPAKLQQYEVDEDGSFIYWRGLDVHLGWEDLEQIADPEAARKAQQKNEDFNKRYGSAVQAVREQAGLKPEDVTGISEKQLRRIENGECRLTSNAIEALSKAHRLQPNEYLEKLARVHGSG